MKVDGPCSGRSRESERSFEPKWTVMDESGRSFEVNWTVMGRSGRSLE